MATHDARTFRAALALDTDLLAAVERIATPLARTAPSPARDSAVAAQAFQAARRLGSDDYGSALYRECLARLRHR